MRFGKIGRAKTASIIALFCFATAVASHAQTFTSLHILTGSNGIDPAGTLTQGTNGNFYGTTQLGISTYDGTVFEITPSGQFTVLYHFCTASGCPDGSGPLGALVQADNGNFYGTTYNGGTGADCPANNGGCGTVFEITPKGALTTIYNFCSQANCADGAFPRGLTLGVNGNLYGTTTGYNGIPCLGNTRTGCGTVFEITPTGTLTTLHEFCSQTNCADGWGPWAALTLGNDGNFYGSNVYGGANIANAGGGGTVFRITPSGKLTTIYSFCAQVGCADGQDPEAALLQGANGDIYGTTYGGGVNATGTIFDITPTGHLTTLYNFCATTGCADGSAPAGALAQGTDGNFYGTTAQGGASNYGTIFELTSGGDFNSLYSFSCNVSACSDGAVPIAGLLQSTNGIFYGTTSSGGHYVSTHNLGNGVAYSWDMGLGAFVQAQLNVGKVGQIVTILGNNLTGTSSVTFNGVAAEFKVESATYLKAQVPTGATTGTIEVTTPSGMLSSNVAFQVLP